MIYFIQEENYKKDKQKRPILAMRQQNRAEFSVTIKIKKRFLRKTGSRINFYCIS